MKRTKFSVNLRNKLSELAMSVDSCAAIELPPVCVYATTEVS